MVSVARLCVGELCIEGHSRAGIETWFRVQPSGIAFDSGRGALELVGAEEIFLTHGHLDHSLGVPFLLSQRTLHHARATRVYCPEATAGPLGRFVAAAAELEGVEYTYEIHGLRAGDRVPLRRELAVEAFATDHVVPSLGFHLLRSRRKLRADLAGVPREEILRRRESEEIHDVTLEQWLSYCGDTGPGVFALSPAVFRSRVLMLECTFLGAAHRDRGARYKHLHLEDLEPFQDVFENEVVILHHLSRRYRVDELRAEVERVLPRLAPRVRLLVE